MTVMVTSSALVNIVTNLNTAVIGHFESVDALALMRITLVYANRIRTTITIIQITLVFITTLGDSIAVPTRFTNTLEILTTIKAQCILVAIMLACFTLIIVTVRLADTV